MCYLFKKIAVFVSVMRRCLYKVPKACLNTFLLTPNSALITSGGLLSDKSQKAVLRLKHLQISQVSDNNSYQLSFTLVHLTKVGGSVKGQATLAVAGMQGDKKIHLKLESLTADKQKSLKMGFKNFQKFDVTLTLPEGFEPVEVTVSADVESKNIENFEQTLPWQVAEL